MPKRKGVFRTKFKKNGVWYYAKRKPDGTFTDIQSMSIAIRRNIKQKAKTKVKPGQGFRGDTV